MSLLINGWSNLSNLFYYLILQAHSFPTAIHKSHSLLLKDVSYLLAKTLVVERCCLSSSKWHKTGNLIK